MSEMDYSAQACTNHMFKVAFQGFKAFYNVMKNIILVGSFGHRALDLLYAI